MKELQSPVRDATATMVGQHSLQHYMSTARCSSQGEYSKPWKEVINILFLKARKEPLKAKNYHPVSLVCCLGKLFERMVNSWLTW